MPGMEDQYVNATNLTRILRDLKLWLRYHWGLTVGPKVEEKDAEGTMFHAKEKMALVDGTVRSVWEFEERPTTLGPTRMILGRILVGKVANVDRLTSVLRSIKIKPTQLGWNCVVWVQEALQGLKEDGKALGTSKLDWDFVRDTAMHYIEQKKSQHRFDGKGEFDQSKVATWDCLEGREIFP